MGWFRDMGCTVTDLSGVGQGVYDLLIGMTAWHGPHTIAVEVKDGAKPASKRKRTPAQVEWGDNWKGDKAIVENQADCIDLVNSRKRK